MKCVACGEDSEYKEHKAREMMFGLRTQFTYAECLHCHSLHLANPPDDLSPYYPSTYYSFKTNPESESFHFKNRLCLLPLGYVLAHFRTNTVMRLIFLAGLRKNWRVLDVGCGNGQLLSYLALAGCRDLHGIDPYLAGSSPDGVDLRACTIFDVTGTFDLVMFHHSFEHMDEPERVLSKARELLAPRGCCIIRIPIVAWAWRTYQSNWVQLDAPRHLHNYSEVGFRSLAERCGFYASRVEYDSNHFQILGSECYCRDIPLCELPPAPKHELAEAMRIADKLNRQRDGDQAAFVLRAI